MATRSSLDYYRTGSGTPTQQPVQGSPTQPGQISQPVTGRPSPISGGQQIGQPVTGGPQPVYQQGSPQPIQTTAAGGGRQRAQSPFLGGNGYNLPPDLDQNLMDSVYQDFQNQQQSANQANEQRYQDILGGYGNLEQAYSDRTQQLSGLLEGFGEAQRQQLSQKFEKQGAGLTQDMINRGLYNTTTLDAARRGMQRDQQYQNVMLEDALTRQKMDYLSQLTGEELGNRPQRLQFMERRTDEGPDLGMLQGLAGLAGQASAGVPNYLSAIWGGQGAGGGSGSGTGGGGNPDLIGDPQVQVPDWSGGSGGTGSGGGRTSLVNNPPDRNPNNSPLLTKFPSQGSNWSTGGTTPSAGGGGGGRSSGGGGSSKYSGLDMSGGGGGPQSNIMYGDSNYVPVSSVSGGGRGFEYAPQAPMPPNNLTDPAAMQRYQQELANYDRAMSQYNEYWSRFNPAGQQLGPGESGGQHPADLPPGEPAQTASLGGLYKIPGYHSPVRKGSNAWEMLTAGGIPPGTTQV